MIFGKQSTAGLLLALFIAATLPAHAGIGLPHVGKKKTASGSAARAQTHGQARTR